METQSETTGSAAQTNALLPKLKDLIVLKNRIRQASKKLENEAREALVSILKDLPGMNVNLVDHHAYILVQGYADWFETPVYAARYNEQRKTIELSTDITYDEEKQEDVPSWKDFDIRTDYDHYSAIRWCDILPEVIAEYSRAKGLGKEAVQIENGQKDGMEALVCRECGSGNVCVEAWVDPNTNEYCGEASGDAFCNDCGEETTLCTRLDFQATMDLWYHGTDFDTMEKIFGVKRGNFPEEDGRRAFVDHCNTGWDKLDYEQKRTIYNKRHDL